MPENYDVNEHIEELTEQDDRKENEKGGDVAPEYETLNMLKQQMRKKKKEG